MKEFVVSARKYRPLTFDEVVGQSHITNTLKNALKTDQLAHAFLFSGPRGVGKTTCARILAKAINCDNPPGTGEPCNECDSCKTFLEGRNMNIHELDAASNNSVDDIRSIIEQVRYVPPNGKRAVFIIDEVHMLSQAAFNAFLKTLEEPPAHAIFILATTERHKILPTILSRCQKFDFRRLKVEEIAPKLEDICKSEEIKFEMDGLQLISLKADGALRDALSIFDQIVSFSGGNVTYDIVVQNLNVLDYDYFFKATKMMQDENHEDLLILLNEIIESGFEPRDFLLGLVEHFRNLMVAATPKTVNMLEVSDNIRQQYLSQSQEVSQSLVLNYFNIASAAEGKLRMTSNPRMLVELTLMKLCYVQQAMDIGSAPGAEKKKLAKPKVEKPKVKKPKVKKPKAESEDSKVEEPKEELSTQSSVHSTPTDDFMIPTSLDQIKKSKPAEEEKAEEEETVTEYDESVEIDGAAFGKAFGEIVQWLEEQNKPSLASILKLENAELDHNTWIQRVANETAYQQLDEAKTLVMMMREKLDISNVRLEIRIEKEWENRRDKLPYTTQEKLEAMTKKNPNLKDFMQRFDVMVDH